MNEEDVLSLLIFCNELDGRHSPNDIKVQAWREVFIQGAPDMHLTFARDAARRHYALLDVMITPSSFVRAWTKFKRLEDSLSVDSLAHCQRAGCMCTHTGQCYRGWVDDVQYSTKPCPICRGSLAQVLGEIAPLGQRRERDYARIRNRYNVNG